MIIVTKNFGYYDPADDTDDGSDDSNDDSSASLREEMGLMSCDDISRYSVSSQSGSKGSEAVSYYLDQDSGQYFSLLEGDGPPGSDYDRVRNTGVRRRDKTPTHGKTASAIKQCEWGRTGSCFESCFEAQLSFTIFVPSLTQPSSLYVHHSLHGSAFLCLFYSPAHVPKTLITCQRVSLRTLSLAPFLPSTPPTPHTHTCVHNCLRQLSRHSAPSRKSLTNFCD